MNEVAVDAAIPYILYTTDLILDYPRIQPYKSFENYTVFSI